MDNLVFNKKASRRQTLFSCFYKDALAEISPDSWSGCTFGICTAGSDTPGMNSVINAVYRFGCFLGCNMVYIKQGFKGMVIGEDNFKGATFESQHDIINKGGTILKSSKYTEFIERKNRLKAAENLVKSGISKLILIGGNGTLKAVKSLSGEWLDLLRDLFDQGKITKQEALEHRHLNIVIVLCSVEADIMSTEFSIGQNSALHRITNAIDAIRETASSNNQAFVIEVFGETSGYLALASGIACQATMIFTPEWPPEADWQKELTSKVEAGSKKGDGIIIIVSEGATDRKGRNIKAQNVADILNAKGIETKVTILGQYQRGGHPTAKDIMAGLRAGAESVVMLKDLSDAKDKGICAIGFIGNEVKRFDVFNIIDEELEFNQCIKELRFVDAVRLKPSIFQDFLATYCIKSILKPSPMLMIPVARDSLRKIGVLKLGQLPQGVTMCLKTCVECLHYNGLKAMGIYDGLEGLVSGNLIELTPEEIRPWKLLSGDGIGSSTKLAEAIGIKRIAKSIKDHELSGLILMGSFEAFESLHQLDRATADYPALRIPMCMVPITLLNNIPGSDNSLGCDTAVNETLEFCLKLKRVAKGRAKTVYIIETLGGNCGYIAFLSGLCCGADAVFTSQNPLTLDIILEHCDRLKHKIRKSIISNGLVVRSDVANSHYSIDVIHKIMSEEGIGVFDCKKSSVGQVTQGCVPSVYDRVHGYGHGIRAGQWMSQNIEENIQRDNTVSAASPSARSVLCFGSRSITFKSVRTLGAEVDFVKKVPTYMWWKKLNSLMNIMATNPEQFFSRATSEEFDTEEMAGPYGDDTYGPIDVARKSKASLF